MVDRRAKSSAKRAPRSTGRSNTRPVSAALGKTPKEPSDEAPVGQSARSAAPANEPDVGPALRRLREDRGLSLEQLAQLTGVSRAMLGQVELGQSVPTIKTLWRIAHALEVPFSALLSSGPSKAAVVLRAAEARTLTSADGGFHSRALFPFGAPRRVEFYELRLKPHAREDAEPHAPGTLENLVVTRGKVEVSCSGQAHELREGDAIVFEADGPHSYRNLGDREAVMYLVMTYAMPNA